MQAAERTLACTRIRLRNFRNFDELELEFPTDGVAVIGDNGSGKTNLLEAIYYLEIFRSFRGAPDEQIVRFGAEAFHLRARFEEPATHEAIDVTAAWEVRSRTKRVTVDDVEPERIGDAIGKAGAVLFSPADVNIVAGSPAERRRFLDIVLSLNVPGYLPALQRYRHALRQRNALLRAGAPAPLLEAWSEGLVAAGSRVLHDRARWTKQHGDAFSRHFEAVGDGMTARLAHRPGLRLEEEAALDTERTAETFARELDRVAQRERERGLTLAGPHRDDLSVLASSDGDAFDLRDFGSGGQLRTAAIALRMIEAETVREARGRAPLILLDDVFAELDAGRSRRILDMLEAGGHGQVILTAPKESDVESREAEGGAFGRNLARWRIAAGRITTG
ncbi:MAG: DNA replication and repair protein RecF [Gemmatimonadota bacterium]|jgi:DNA replication and repair protein RecF